MRDRCLGSTMQCARSKQLTDNKVLGKEEKETDFFSSGKKGGMNWLPPRKLTYVKQRLVRCPKILKRRQEREKERGRPQSLPAFVKMLPRQSRPSSLATLFPATAASHQWAGLDTVRICLQTSVDTRRRGPCHRPLSGCVFNSILAEDFYTPQF